MKQLRSWLSAHQLITQIVLVCLADALVGVSYGAMAVTSGFDLWVPLSLSLLVLAGASEFLFIGILGAGGSAITAAIAGILVNTRLLAFGFGLNHQLSRGWRRLLACHLMNDESVVFGVSQKNDELNKKAYWLSGLGILLVWPLGALAGAMLGGVIQDTHALGLDAMFPAILIALVLPKLDDYKKFIRALSGTFISILSTPFLPVGLPVLLSLTGILMKRRRKDG